MTKKVRALTRGDEMRAQLIANAREQARWLQGHVADDRMGAQDLNWPDHRALVETLAQIPEQDMNDASALGATAVGVCAARNMKRPGRISSLTGRLPAPEVSGLLAKEYHLAAAKRHTFQTVLKVLKIFGKAINPNNPPI